VCWAQWRSSTTMVCRPRARNTDPPHPARASGPRRRQRRRRGHTARPCLRRLPARVRPPSTATPCRPMRYSGANRNERSFTQTRNRRDSGGRPPPSRTRVCRSSTFRYAPLPVCEPSSCKSGSEKRLMAPGSGPRSAAGSRPRNSDQIQISPSSATASRSLTSSAAEASIRCRLNSSMSRPCTIS
jgi:hypothetical protein